MKKEERYGYWTDICQPWVFVWGERRNPNSEYSSTDISNGSELLALLTSAGCLEQFETVYSRICKHNTALLMYGIILLVGQWRPKPIISDIPGLAKGGASKCEILPYLVTWSSENVEKDLINVDVKSLNHLATTDSEMLRNISGYDNNGFPITVIGCGAINSHIVNNLMRAGNEKITLVDYDVLQPHNIARHVLNEHDHLLHNKAEALRKYVLSINTKINKASIRAYPDNLLTLNKEAHKKILQKSPSIIIDGTADKRVRNYLASHNINNFSRLLRVEIGYDGQIGLLSVEGKERNPRIDDLNAWLGFLALEDDLISEWLKNESDNAKRPSFNTGLSCASSTMVMPNSTVCLYAASMTPIVEMIRRESAVLSNIYLFFCKKDDGLISSKHYHVPVFKVIYNKEIKWDLRVAQPVYEELNKYRVANSSYEIGGFLYGRWDTVLKTITVVLATPPVASIESSESRLKLPPAGESAFENHLYGRCGVSLAVLGSWHSHTKGNANMSPADEDTFKYMIEENEKDSRPSTMLIISPNGQNAYFDVPGLWK